MDSWPINWGHVSPGKIPSPRPRRQQEACHVWAKVDNEIHLTPYVLPSDYLYPLPIPDLCLYFLDRVPRSLLCIYPIREICIFKHTHVYINLIRYLQIFLQSSLSLQNNVQSSKPDTSRPKQTPNTLYVPCPYLTTSPLACIMSRHTCLPIPACANYFPVSPLMILCPDPTLP